jgi:hypothetical protein
VIGLLRSLDVSLPTIAEVLSGASVRGVLGDVRDQMEADLARRVRALQTVERMLALGMPSADVSVLQRPALDVAVIRDTSTLQRIAATTSACVTGLLRAFEAAGVELTGPIVGIFPLDLPDSAAATTGNSYSAGEEAELAEFDTVHGLGITGKGEPGARRTSRASKSWSASLAH